MLYIKYAIGVTIIVVVLGSIVPMIQFFIEKRKLSNHNSDSTKVVKFVFSKKDFDSDYDYNAVSSTASLTPRILVGTRGWIRGAQGQILTDYEFKQKKSIEYQIDLP